MRYIKLTRVGFWLHFRIASRIVIIVIIDRPTLVRTVLYNVVVIARASAGFWFGGSMPSCRLRRRNFENLTIKWCILFALFFACFRFLIFHPFFQGGQLTPFAAMCGLPWVVVFIFRWYQAEASTAPRRVHYAGCAFMLTRPSSGVSPLQPRRLGTLLRVSK